MAIRCYNELQDNQKEKRQLSSKMAERESEMGQEQQSKEISL